MKEEELAFPAIAPGAGGYSSGMTLRDWFAGKALQGLSANTYAWEEKTINEQVKMAFEYADAMMKERK